jgi:eukaryotic-like serine/threonine-protein kinase
MAGLIGAAFGGMRLEQEIGRGSHAQVFLGRNKASGQTVAIKIFGPAYGSDAIFQRLLEDFARQASAVRDPHLVAVLGAGVEQGCAYLAMEYIAGGTLRSRLRQSDIVLLERLTLARQSALALATLHRHGLMHGDVTPSNILLDPPASLAPPMAGTSVARLADYGISLLRSTTEGDAAYIAPERWRQNQMSSAGDIYALGVVLYELCAGRVPFHAGTRIEAAQKHHSEPPPPIRMFAPDLPASVEAIINRCLEKNPTARYASADVLAADLLAVIRPLQPPAPKTIVAPATPPPPINPPPNLRVRLESASAQPLGEWPIGQTDLRVGREPDNQIRLPAHDTMISRHHLRIHWDGHQITVEDLASGNGTSLAGQRIKPNQPMIWPVGDEVRLGTYRLSLEDPQPPPAPPQTVVITPAPAPPGPDPQMPAHKPERGITWIVAAFGLGGLGLSLVLTGVAQALIVVGGLILLACAAVLMLSPKP